jgi:hypothetical protein
LVDILGLEMGDFDDDELDENGEPIRRAQVPGVVMEEQAPVVQAEVPVAEPFEDLNDVGEPADEGLRQRNVADDMDID